MHRKSKQPSMPTTQDAHCKYWIAPIGNIGTSASDQIARELIGKHRIFAISETIYSRNTPRQGDRICFYASGVGVVGDGEIGADPERKVDPRIPNPQKYPYVFPVRAVRMYMDHPVVLNDKFRSGIRALTGSGEY